MSAETYEDFDVDNIVDAIDKGVSPWINVDEDGNWTTDVVEEAAED